MITLSHDLDLPNYAYHIPGLLSVTHLYAFNNNTSDHKLVKAFYYTLIYTSDLSVISQTTVTCTTTHLGIINIHANTMTGVLIV